MHRPLFTSRSHSQFKLILSVDKVPLLPQRSLCQLISMDAAKLSRRRRLKLSVEIHTHLAPIACEVG
jgi:hypothetical protein